MKRYAFIDGALKECEVLSVSYELTHGKAHHFLVKTEDGFLHEVYKLYASEDRFRREVSCNFSSLPEIVTIKAPFSAMFVENNELVVTSWTMNNNGPFEERIHANCATVNLVTGEWKLDGVLPSDEKCIGYATKERLLAHSEYDVEDEGGKRHVVGLNLLLGLSEEQQNAVNELEDVLKRLKELNVSIMMDYEGKLDAYDNTKLQPEYDDNGELLMRDDPDFHPINNSVITVYGEEYGLTRIQM